MPIFSLDLPERYNFNTNSNLNLISPTLNVSDYNFSSRLSIKSSIINLFTFIFFPINFLDMGFFVTLAFLESFLWLFIYLTLIKEILISRKMKIKIPKIAQFCFFFVLSFVILSSFFEENFGTALRHRSVVLYPIIFAIVITRLNRKKFIKFD